LTAYTLFGQPASPASVVADTNAYTMGVQFSVSAAATLSAVWFWSGPGTAALPSAIALYAVSGQSLVHSETAAWSGAAGSGWVRAAFTSPPALAAGTAYKAAVFYPASGAPSDWYSSTAHYWDTGAGSGGITSGPLSAPASSGADGGQDTFTQSGTIAYPDSSFGAANYWADPEVTVTAAVTGNSSLLMLAAKLLRMTCNRS
jgi:hypothetical protein